MTIQELIDLLMRIPRAKREKSIVCYSYTGETTEDDGILPLVLRKSEVVPIMANTKFDRMDLSLRAGKWISLCQVGDETEFDIQMLYSYLKIGEYFSHINCACVNKEENEKDRQYGRNMVRIAKKFLEEYEK